MEPNKKKIGVVGLGYVGGAVHDWFRTHKERPELFLYDKHKKIGSMDEVNRADIIFVMVPTPFRSESGFDGSAVEESVDGISDSKTIVIKSTVLPGTTAGLQKKYPKKKILFNPEFLRAKSAGEDFIHPDRQIMGVTEQSKDQAELTMRLLPQAPHMQIISSTEAETVKYFGNVFLSTKVIFANQMYDFCAKLGIDYDVVKECAARDPRIGISHLDIDDGGYRGYGGSCLPKDTKAFVQFAREQGVPLKLLETIEEVNKELNGDRWCA